MVGSLNIKFSVMNFDTGFVNCAITDNYLYNIFYPAENYSILEIICIQSLFQYNKHFL